MSKEPVNDERWERCGVKLSRHFANSTRKLREMALNRKEYDPARLFKWGQMMALAVVRMMKGAEKNFEAKTCRFEIQLLLPGEREREWTQYSAELAERALKRISQPS